MTDDNDDDDDDDNYMYACRIVGFHNTPYVTGRQVNVRTEILPHASLAVTKQIIRNSSQYSYTSHTAANILWFALTASSMCTVF